MKPNTKKSEVDDSEEWRLANLDVEGKESELAESDYDDNYSEAREYENEGKGDPY